MNQRRKPLAPPSIEIELFPFLSVLVCTIGSLLFLIIIVSVQAVNQDWIPMEIIANKEGKTARFVECSDEGIIIYNSKQEFIPSQAIASSNAALITFLDEISQQKEQEYILVVIRPSGIANFKKVRYLVESRNIDIGYVPFREKRPLRIKEQIQV